MSDKVLVLRTCEVVQLTETTRELHGYNNFVWPESGYVEAPDWDPKPVCGKGLHGLLWGTGNAALIPTGNNRIWLAVEVDSNDIVHLDDRVKFRCGNVVCCGDMDTVVSYVADKAPNGTVVHFWKKMVGDYQTVAVGDYGTAIAGHYGTATARNYGTATAGFEGIAIAGYYGTAIAGSHSITIAGNYGKAIVGYHGTATASYHGKAQAGIGGCIQIKWWDGHRHHLVVGYVGEDGIEANAPYQCNENGKLVKV